MRSVFIDTLNTNLQIHDNQTNIDFWIQTPIEGLDSPDYRITEYDKPGEDGAVIPSMFYSSRGITLKGIIKGANPTIYESNRRAFAAACTISRDSNNYPTPKRVVFTTTAGSTYFVDAYFRKPIFALEEVNSTHFMLNLRVTQPSIFGSQQVSSGAILRATGGGFILPVILPIVSTSSSGGTVTLNNQGDMTAKPIITLTGPLTNPFMYSVRENKVMQLNYVIPLGSSVVIDMAEKTIILNDDSSILSTKTSDSDWWGIEPGNNKINFSTGSSSDTGSMEIVFNPSYLSA